MNFSKLPSDKRKENMTS